MEENREVWFGEECVGSVQIKTQGLYYHISAQCRLSGQVVCKLIAKGECGQLPLGVLVPERGSFRLNTKVAVNKLGHGEIQFYIQPKHEKAEGEFVPIVAEEPFEYLSRLTQGYLQVRNQQPGIVFYNESTNSTGQWSEP